MKVLVAKYAGFCFGVQRAVDMALQLSNPSQPVYTLGEIIHNPSVVQMLREHNVFPIVCPEEAPAGSSIIIRSHGVGPQVLEACARQGLQIIDATCPFVKRIHQIVTDCLAKGMDICIAGQPNHPEVLGILGWANDKAYVLPTPESCAALPELTNAALVAQTTLQPAMYDEIFQALQPHCGSLTRYDTICSTTSQRQAEAASLAQQCTRMVVVGGYNSSNTQKLAQLCKKYCKNTESIENPGQLLLEKIQSNDIIGVVAGASTPDWMIREVVTVMSELEKTTAESIEMEATQAQTEAQQAEPVVQEAPQAEPVAEAAPVVADAAAATEPIAAEAAQSTEAAESDSFAEAF